ncbi:MAG TPA: tRNA (guanosine(46)-N7)-methyltransferase TrmB [Dysgonamonadaceae bacterium]|jgi:tRNA (guanine-N7-)-methyltransferase|nr:tRNA (guanosine(46)-N7)-methyltransferase TrmB [Dysgonamonadaceae bacterium]HOV36939.1 tRNA (guanosine(46)-N7)-methyltransferase TrmB [Dysgonamonadaceae bacterium]HPD43494.1 tRNA (guanosine(46)-N7)-methyltransferase TrmB [Dysgonamonadaceae bacterium]HQG08487.1 tRNA (guanosine(46)-N7)-methyltransferase TrmB [Dysgonamonadaceae bacterium]HRS42017.1 tRNA (guanosine(46)-N7)-methyltransferase TrmB [Dysgonamonadaceae bacterium]
MGKNKLTKFAEMASYSNVFQYPFEKLKNGLFPLKGRWNEEYFRNENPIVLELGCGKGEYTVELAKLFPEKNFIGIDIKGARMWSGATEAIRQNLKNVAFVRTHIELIHHFFAEKEISEIWITFPDPQMNKTNKRLTSTRFMREYGRLLNENGIVHLKTDSNFLYTYTKEMIHANHLDVYFETDDLYRSEWQDPILQIQTFYEQQWRARGLNIKYIQFACPPKNDWTEPDIEIEKDDYRSFGRNANFNKSIDK